MKSALRSRLLARPVALLAAGLVGLLGLVLRAAHARDEWLLGALMLGVALALVVRAHVTRPARSCAVDAVTGALAVSALTAAALHEVVGAALRGTVIGLLVALGPFVGGWWVTRLGRARVDSTRVLLLPSAWGMSALGLLVLDQATPVSPLALGLACATIAALLVRMAVTLSENLKMVAASRGEAHTDPLTGLANRRRLVADLEAELAVARAGSPRILVLFDLDGFKRYNDSFGHLAGDALLARLGAKLQAAVAPDGRAYRLGGDEFCAVAPAREEAIESLLARAGAALSETGEGFTVTSSYGAVLLPHEAADAVAALQIADQRMYTRKERRPSPAREQTHDVLVRALHARRPALPSPEGTAELAIAVARRLHVDGEEVDEVARAAELHDVGNVAVPDAILDKPAALDEQEWSFMRRHPVLGERILNGAPAMRPVARLVRSTHERFDGGGYPDGLRGEEIPLGARIVSVCGAYEAMTSGRPYRHPVDHLRAERELRRAAGTQFDPVVVEAFLAEMQARAGGAAGPSPEPHRTAAQEVATQLRETLSHAATAERGTD